MGLETFFPEVRHTFIGGKNVAVAPLKIRQIPSFYAALSPVIAAHGVNLAAAMVTHGENLIAALAIATGESQEWIGELDADEFLALAADVFEVNSDFFIQRVMPAMKETTKRINQSIAGISPLPTSSNEDTDSTTA